MSKYKPFSSQLLALLLLFVVSTLAFAQKDDIPSRPNPPRLVNDFAGLLNQQEQMQLEHKLVAFNDSTSTQIAVAIVKSMNGYEPNDMATRILEKWGIGQKGKNNGILILVKPKTQDEKGKVYITTGYGVEGSITDALSKRIVENDILPSFRDNQFYQGLDKATTTLMALVKGQFTPDEYMKKHQRKKHSNFPLGAIVIIVILIAVFASRGNGGRNMSSGGSSIPFWLLMGSLLGGNRSGGYGDFNSGGGDFGSSDDGGGFGGFGGGSGGGGGAGGEW